MGLEMRLESSSIKLVATSDLHGHLPQIPACDLLVICGDICPDFPASKQSEWLDTKVRDWLNTVPAKEIVCIAGNHDRIFEQASHLVPKNLRWHYLQDSAIELFDLKIYGSPWQLPFWGSFNLQDKELQPIYAKIPEDIDIMLSHTPVYGILDEVPQHHGILHTGSVSLREKMLQVRPQLFLCGHIHCSFGRQKVDETIFANVSLLDDNMNIAHEPVPFDIRARARVNVPK